MPKRIFVSATSRDLGSFRTLASECLRRRGYEVDDQAIFRLTYLEISEKLKKRIQDCDAVVCLIGFVYGGEPSHCPVSEPRRSYNQWEYFFARKYGKPVFILVAEAGTRFDPHTPEEEVLRKLQDDFRKEVTLDRDWKPFASSDQLRAELAELRFPWEDLLDTVDSEVQDWFGRPLRLLSYVFSDAERFVKEMNDPRWAGRRDWFAYLLGALTPWVLLLSAFLGSIIAAIVKCVLGDEFRMLPTVMTAVGGCFVVWLCLSLILVTLIRSPSSFDMARCIPIVTVISVVVGISRAVPTGYLPNAVAGVHATVITSAIPAALLGLGFAIIVQVAEAVETMVSGRRQADNHLIVGFLLLTGLVLSMIRAGLVLGSRGVSESLLVLAVVPVLYIGSFALIYLRLGSRCVRFLMGAFAKVRQGLSE
jgi:hypothetical protein